ncbi:MAG: 4Fe-4S binding protein [Clostridia bacterium]|nr:4Fe-4S binding protein [Clostridia bacterium]
MAKVIIDIEICKGCGLCVRACPKHLLGLAASKLNSRGYQPAEISDQAACIGCAACARTCPDLAIEIEK